MLCSKHCFVLHALLPLVFITIQWHGHYLHLHLTEGTLRHREMVISPGSTLRARMRDQRLHFGTPHCNFSSFVGIIPFFNFWSAVMS